MMRSPISLVAMGLVWFAGGPFEAVGQEQKAPQTLKLAENERSPPAKIADLAWLQGRWIGEGLGGTVEEMWTPPLADSMLGSFRLVKNGKVVFSEHCVIVEAEGSLVLKVKHFDKDFKAWEEKDQAAAFKLVKLTPSEAYFDGLTMRRGADGSVQMFVAIKNKKTGAVREEEFRYRKGKDE